MFDYLLSLQRLGKSLFKFTAALPLCCSTVSVKCKTIFTVGKPAPVLSGALHTVLTVFGIAASRHLTFGKDSAIEAARQGLLTSAWRFNCTCYVPRVK